MINVVIVAALVIVIGLAVRYIVKEKKKGKCIGCPYASTCHSAGNTVSSCGCDDDMKTTSYSGHENVK